MWILWNISCLAIKMKKEAENAGRYFEWIHLNLFLSIILISNTHIILSKLSSEKEYCREKWKKKGKKMNFHLRIKHAGKNIFRNLFFSYLLKISKLLILSPSSSLSLSLSLSRFLLQMFVRNTKKKEEKWGKWEEWEMECLQLLPFTRRLLLFWI